VRWLVTGSAGMLGTDLVEAVRRRGYDVAGVTRASADLGDPEGVRELVDGFDVVVNCAAWTAVDDAETQEADALQVNGVVPDLLARAVAAGEGRLVHVSTDYVFDGLATSPYAEDTPTSPASAYGRTKAAGEEAVRTALPERHLVVRTAWLYGAHGGCFPRTIARVAREKGEVSVVDDQVGQPTWTVDVADLVVRLVEAGVPAGTYHATSSGQCSWFDFAREVVTADGLDPAIVKPTTSDQFVRPAPRPAYSVLGHDALVRHGVDPIGDWRERWRVAAPLVLSPPAG
jgi:dTDP-4-dehydrorhamnose reductase